MMREEPVLRISGVGMKPSYLGWRGMTRLAFLGGVAVIVLFPIRHGLSGSDSIAPTGKKQTEFAGAVEVRLGTIVVAVLDKKNQPVTGLDPDDFVLVVDGERHDITNFTEVREGEAILKTSPPTTQPGQQPEVREEVFTTRPGPRLLAVVVDTDNISIFNRNHLIKRARQFIENSVQPPNLGMVLTNEMNPKVRCPPTTSSREIIVALEELMDEVAGAALHKGSLRFAEDKIYAAYFERSDPIAREAAMGLARITAGQIDINLKTSIETLKTICRALGGFDGKKDLLYISDGLPMTPGEELFRLIEMAGPPGLSMNAQSALTELHNFYRAPLFEELTNQSIAADVTLHTVDARGLMTEHDTTADRRMGMPVNYGSIKAKNYQEPLRYLAAQTGGIAIVNTNEFEKELETVEDAVTRYYSLGFRLGPRDGDVLHSIDIELPGHPDFKARYRREFLERSAATLAADRTMSGLLLDPAQNSLGVTIEIERTIRQGKKKWIGEVAVDIPGLNLVPIPGEGGSTAALSIFAVAASEKGRSPLTRTRQSIVLSSDRSAPLELQIILDLDPGFNRVSIGVLDETSGIDGFAVAETTVR
jgi:VWFA-related protein